ncbi:MAG: prolyl oligopeptidase family serine peptidase [Pirellulales bacterium]
MSARFANWSPPAKALLSLCLGASAVLPILTDPQRARSTPPEPVVEARQVAPQQRWWEQVDKGVYKARIEPHWLGESPRFWYRNELRDDQREFTLVDAEKNTQGPAFDQAKLAASLSVASGQTYSATGLPLDEIEFAEDCSAIQFTVDGTRWSCALDSYDCTKWKSNSPDDQNGSAGDSIQGRGRRGPRGRDFDPDESAADGRDGGPSPDGKWTSLVRDGNVVLKAEGGGKEIQLSHDGTESHGYGMLQWAPDSKTLVAFRIEPGEEKEVYLVESSPAGGGRAKLRTRPYPLPGDRFTAFELNLFNVETIHQSKPDVDTIDFDWPNLHWYPDGRNFAYQQVDRGHQRLRVIRVDASGGEAMNIIDEKTDTFIWTAHTENLDLQLVNWLKDSDEIIYVSERDGWRHLYLVDAKQGGIKNQITSGEYVVRGIDHIDEDKRQIWFHASGKNPGQDPYFLHFYRVNFDGTELVALTEGNGSHSVQFSPDREYLIDTYSRVDSPPMHELRRTKDGSLIRRLEEADVTELHENGWRPLEVFQAKGRDGKTDIWGVICRPRDFDPDKKYPVIESIYAGPQGSFVPKSFRGANQYSTLADLGFIVVQIDGMGTANRSKAFHDVCWHNLKDAGFPDRILWMKAAAEKYPSMDLSRVGIYGGSAGGQNATGGVLFHPEFYQVAVSGCGCHDNRMDKASWNEQWMGYPVGPQYSECSNIDNAHRLQGKLMLIVGELDDNVPTESTFRLADALIKAGKDFDLVVVPGMGHGMGGEYGVRRMQDFFVRHLLGQESPDRNATVTQPIAQSQAESALPAASQTAAATSQALVAVDPERRPDSRAADRAWPHPIPCRVRVDKQDDLFVMTLGDVTSELSNGTFDPEKDEVRLADGTVLEHYYRDTLGIKYYQPLDKSQFPLPPTGWCTWYYYYPKITATEVKRNVKWIADNLKDLGAQYVQIDDGWQGAGGREGQRDWTVVNSDRFPDGMEELASYISSLGLTPGIWLAPHGQSRDQVVKDNPNVFLLKEDGSSASETWEGRFLVDPTTPESRTYMRDLFGKLSGWGYRYYKIDGQPIVVDEYAEKKKFMKHPQDDTNALYRDTLQTMRSAIGPESYLLGCWGTPVEGIGIMNGSRTGGDVVRGWQGGFMLAMRATMRHYYLHNVAWYADPDTMLLRSPLTVEQARAWATLQGLTGQALMSSDRLMDLSADRVEMLKRICPAVEIRPLDLFPAERDKRVLDLKINHLGRDYDVVGLFNYDEDRSQQLHLKWHELGVPADRPVHVYDFWNHDYLGAWKAGMFVDVPPTSCRVLTLLPSLNRPQLISTSRHVTQGWVDLANCRYDDAAIAYSGKSRVVRNDSYGLTFVFPREKNFKVKSATANAAAGPLPLEITNHQGWATVKCTPHETSELTWRVEFEPTDAFHYPPEPVEKLRVESHGSGNLRLIWNESYWLNAGYNVYLDKQLLGYTPRAEIPLGELDPDKTYTVEVETVSEDGSSSRRRAQVTFTPSSLESE